MDIKSISREVTVSVGREANKVECESVNIELVNGRTYRAAYYPQENKAELTLWGTYEQLGFMFVWPNFVLKTLKSEHDTDLPIIDGICDFPIFFAGQK